MNKRKGMVMKRWFVVALLFSLINLGYHSFAYFYSEEDTRNDARELANYSTSQMASEINKRMSYGQNYITDAVNELERLTDYTNFDFEDFTKEKAAVLPNVLGVTVSFEPGVYPNETGLFSMYYDKELNKAQRIDTLYNYTNDSLPNAKWYTTVAHLKKPKWIDPYFASGAQSLVTDYSIPLFNSGEFIGVISYTVSINNLISIIHEISMEQNGIGIIINKNGMVISHPNPDFVLKRNIMKMVSDSDAVARVFNEESGFVESYLSPSRGELSLSFETLINQDWKLVNVFSHEELFVHGRKDKQRMINLFMSFTLVLAMALLLVINREGINTSEAWIYSVFITVALIANISFIWYLNLSDKYEDISNEQNQIRKVSDIRSYVGSQNSQRRIFGQKELIEVPTGVYVEKFEHEDTYNVGISGWIWQRYPINSEIEPGIHFPQLSPFAESAYTEIVSVDSVGDEVLVKWNFRSTFIFDFQYLKFPFNTKNVVLQFCYPDYNKGVVFTPDVLAYESLEPIQLPGILPNSANSSVNYVASVFSLSESNMKGNLGANYSSDNRYTPVMQFEIKSRIPFLNALIKQIIPILLISLMMFLLLFSLRKKDGESKSIGIETVAGLLFILVLSHIDFRQTIFSPEVTYLETFYFVIYVMMAIISISIVFVDLQRYTFFTRNDLNVIKLTYWPFFFLSVLIITLSIFY